jgi:DNA-binding NarL/FixJ family response regulator
VWGLLSATFELERDPTNLLAQLESLPKTATSRVRVANAKLSYAYRGGVPVSEALAEAEGVLPILSRVDDPMVRSAFLNLLVGNLGAAGRYDEALKFVEDELRIIRDYGLDFALPHALTLRGVGCTGIRRFVDAQRNLNEADRLARESGDVFSLRNAELQRVRLHLCKGELELASNLAERLGAMPTKGTQGELLSARVLAAAALGNVQLAEKLVRGAEALTNAVEVRRFIDWSRVVIAFQKNEKTARGAARAAFDEAVSDGCVHPFVCAYRAFPPLLDSSDLAETRYEDLAKTLTLAHDQALASRVGIAVGGRLGELSKRETEVLSLLAEGLSNKTIAERLFISDVTVKAHVRRIFEKLRVHSRTEAALMAASGLARDREL